MIWGWVLSVLGSLVIGYFVGFRNREIRDFMLKTLDSIKEKADKKPDFVENKSALLDPYDVQHQVQREHDEMMRKLNNR